MGFVSDVQYIFGVVIVSISVSAFFYFFYIILIFHDFNCR